MVEWMAGGRVQISHAMQRAKTPEDAEEGWYLMQDITRLMQQQQKKGKYCNRLTGEFFLNDYYMCC